MLTADEETGLAAVTPLYCLRKVWHKIRRDKATPHYLTIRGYAVHKMIQYLFQGMNSNEAKLKAELDSKQEYSVKDERVWNHLKDDLVKYEQIFNEWRLQTQLDLKDALIESEVQFEVKGQLIKAQLDLFTDDFIIDFKTSQGRVLESHLMQLAIYRKLLEDQDGLKRRCFLIYLTDKGFIEKELGEDDLNRTYRKYLDRLIQVKDLIQNFDVGEPPECSFSFECLTCEYRGICLGV